MMIFAGLLDYQMYLIPTPKGLNVSNVPEVLGSVNRKAEISISYYVALQGSAKSYVSSQDQSIVGLPDEFIASLGRSI